MSERTTISVAKDTADRLYDRKGRTQSYDNLLNRLLDETGQ